jgi:DNA polymerase-3 subunit delta
MPIHLYWGDDQAALDRAIQSLIDQVVDPAWQSLNLSRLDGSNSAEAAQALSEARTAPFGAGDRLVLLQNSPFCHTCPAELSAQLEPSLNLIPSNCHLLLINGNKPDARLRSTKALKAVAIEKSFALPAIWDGAGQLDLVLNAAHGMGLQIRPQAAEALAETVGNNSSRLAGELEKLSLYCGDQSINVEAVAALAGPSQENALAVGEALLAGHVGEALLKIDGLLAMNEPSLRLLAALTSQLRGWLWVSLLDREGEQDVALIAKAAGIGNPKRIYVMRKQLRGKSTELLLNLMGQLLEVEAALKLGVNASDAFRDGLLSSFNH